MLLLRASERLASVSPPPVQSGCPTYAIAQFLAGRERGGEDSPRPPPPPVTRRRDLARLRPRPKEPPFAEKIKGERANNLRAGRGRRKGERRRCLLKEVRNESFIRGLHATAEKWFLSSGPRSPAAACVRACGLLPAPGAFSLLGLIIVVRSLLFSCRWLRFLPLFGSLSRPRCFVCAVLITGQLFCCGVSRDSALFVSVRLSLSSRHWRRCLRRRVLETFLGAEKFVRETERMKI